MSISVEQPPSNLPVELQAWLMRLVNDTAAQISMLEEENISLKARVTALETP